MLAKLQWLLHITHSDWTGGFSLQWNLKCVSVKIRSCITWKLSKAPIPSSTQVCAHTCNWSPSTGAGHRHKMALRLDTVYTPKTQVLSRGVTRIFQRGVTLCQNERTRQIVTLFSPLVVRCVLKIWLTREDHRHPRTPPLLTTPLLSTRLRPCAKAWACATGMSTRKKGMFTLGTNCEHSVS